MLRRLMETDEDPSPLVLRVVLGLVMMPHGAQHLLGWFGGPGLQGSVPFFSGVLGLPAITVALVIAAELLGGAALAAGVLSQLGALAVAVLMVGAAVTVHLPHGFFMNWFGTQKGEGWEYHLLALAMSAVIMINGVARGRSTP